MQEGDIADLLPEPLLVVTAQGVVHAANRAATRLLGQSREALTGRRLHALVREAGEQVDQLLVRGSRSTSLLPGSLSFNGPRGEPLACRCESALLRPRTDTEPALLMLRLGPKAEASDRFLLLRQRIDQLSREITRRRQAEDALVESREWYRVTLESIGDAVIVTDAQGQVSFMNAVAQQLTGWQVQDAMGRHLDEVFVIVNEDTRAAVESPVAKVLRLGGIVGLANHTVLIRKDGSELPIDDSGAPIRSAKGDMLGVVLVFRDLSERYRLERELVQKTRRLEDADRRKDEFLSMLAHELRNPLAPLRNGVHLLSTRHAEVPGVSRLAGMMGRQLEHMVRLVNDLLDVARLTHGAIKLQKTRIALADVIDQAVEMMRPQMQQCGLHFTAAQAPPQLVLEGDLTRLVQVVANVLANAAKFTHAGGSIHVGLAIEGAEAVLSVTDNGVGIAADLLPDVFELFVQADMSLERPNSGLGIGLTVARRIVLMHGGTIEARSRGPGLGSEFIVRLPLAGG